MVQGPDSYADVQQERFFEALRVKDTILHSSKP